MNSMLTKFYKALIPCMLLAPLSFIQIGCVKLVQDEAYATTNAEELAMSRAKGNGSLLNRHSPGNQSVSEPLSISTPQPNTIAHYSFNVNGSYRGEYSVRFSGVFYFNNERAFSAEITTEHQENTRIYRASDYAFLGAMSGNTINRVADPYQLTMAQGAQTHYYLWRNYLEQTSIPIEQHIAPVGALNITMNDQSYDATEWESLYKYGEQEWYQRSIWLNSVGIVYQIKIHSNDAVEEHQLIRFSNH